MTKIWICGNSHVGALREGLARLAPADLDMRVFPLGNGRWEAGQFFGVEDGRVALVETEYRNNVSRVTGAPYLDDSAVWVFCMGTHSARLYRQPFWREAEPAEIAQAGLRPVAQCVLDRMIATDQRYVCEFLLATRATGIRLAVVSCPPPRRNHPCIAAGTRADVVSYIDRRTKGWFTDWAQASDIPFIPYPDGAADEDGFLTDELLAVSASREEDPHHANGEYGLRTMRKVAGAVRALV